MANFPNCPLSPGSPVWAYLRDSGGETQDLSSQRKYLMDYCKYHNLYLLRLFEDAARPGSSSENREQFQVMMDLARQEKKPQVDAILCWDMKRFARNQNDSMYYESSLERRGYKIFFIADNIPDNEFAPIVKAVLRLNAQRQLEDISRDSKRGLKLIIEAKDEQGNYLGVFPGKPPTCFIAEKIDLGLIRNNGTPRVVQRIIPGPTWEAGQLAWQMRAERASYKEIQEACKLFNAQIIDSCYASFFRNRIYLGELHYGGRVYQEFVPALTDLEIWEKVQIRHSAQRTTYFIGGRGTYLLSGLCQCWYCKSLMYGGQNTRKDRSKFWRFYLCHKKQLNRASCESKQASADRLENGVVALVCDFLLTPSYINKRVEEANHLLNDTETIQANIDLKQQQVSKLKRSINKLLDALESGSSVGGRLMQREGELKQAEREFKQLQSQLTRRASRVDSSVIEAILEEIIDDLTKKEFKIKQSRLRELITKIEVKRDVFNLHCQLPFGLFTTQKTYMPPRESVLFPCQVFTSTY